MPEPGWSFNGFGMKDAYTFCSSATSFTTSRKVMMLSAVVSASAYRRSISCCPGAASWWLNSTEMPIDSRWVIACRRKSCADPVRRQVEVAGRVDRRRLDALALLRLRP